jgi:hypothetical protein
VVVCLGLAFHVVLELVPFPTLTLAKGAGFVLDLVTKLLDFPVEAFPSGLSTHAN